MNLLKGFYLIIGLCLINLSVFSQEILNSKLKAVDIEKVSQNESLSTYFQYYEDETNQLKLNDVLEKDFKKINKDVANFGFSTSSYWLKFSLINNANNTVNRLLYIQKPLQDSIQLYSQQESNKLYSSGCMVLEKDKVISGSSTYFPISVLGQSKQNYILKIDSKYGISVNVNLIDEDEYFRLERIELMAMCLLIGALLTISMYNFFLGYALKDSLYIIYALAVISSLLTQLTARGFMKLYLIPDTQFILQWSPPFFISLSTIITSIFCVKFLNTKIFDKLSHKLLMGIVCFMIFAFFFEFVKYEIFSIRSTNMLVAIGLMFFGFVALFAGIRVYVSGGKSAKYLIFAWLLYCITIVIYVLTLLAWIPINSFTTNAYMFGSFVEVILLSFALADRYNRFKFDKEVLLKRLVLLDSDIKIKRQEVISLMAESVQQLKNKAQLTHNLKRLYHEEEGVSLKSILTELRSESNEDSKKLLIKENIEIYHSEFISKLKKLHPDLTSTDIEIASYSKLKLSRKEMAELRGTSIEAIKSARARLKKRLFLMPGVLLNDYIDGI